jgi:hypothetical protein
VLGRVRRVRVTSPLGPDGDHGVQKSLRPSRGPCQLHWGPMDLGIVVSHLLLDINY